MTFARPFAVATLALVIGTAGPALAPIAGWGTAGAQTAQISGAEVDSEELAAFVRATLSMAELRETYIDRISSAGSDAEQQALVEEGNAAMMTAIEDEPGMTVERYIAINEAAQADEELNARILSTLEEMSGEG